MRLGMGVFSCMNHMTFRNSLSLRTPVQDAAGLSFTINIYNDLNICIMDLPLNETSLHKEYTESYHLVPNLQDQDRVYCKYNKDHKNCDCNDSCCSQALYSREKLILYQLKKIEMNILTIFSVHKLLRNLEFPQSQRKFLVEYLRS
jgi:hypothetical protein